MIILQFDIKKLSFSFTLERYLLIAFLLHCSSFSSKNFKYHAVYLPLCSHSQIRRNYACTIERDLRAKDVVIPNKQLRLSLANLNRNVKNFTRYLLSQVDIRSQSCSDLLIYAYLLINNNKKTSLKQKDGHS